MCLPVFLSVCLSVYRPIFTFGCEGGDEEGGGGAGGGGGGGKRTSNPPLRLYHETGNRRGTSSQPVLLLGRARGPTCACARNALAGKRQTCRAREQLWTTHAATAERLGPVSASARPMTRSLLRQLDCRQGLATVARALVTGTAMQP